MCALEEIVARFTKKVSPMEHHNNSIDNLEFLEIRRIFDIKTTRES